MALYRKYRPATFAEVVGQEQVTQPLSAALDTGRINHAYLFSGPRGCGKTSSARIMARSLNCVQGPTSTPCGECASCVSLAPGGPGNLDVTELDAASHNSVEDMRELRERAYYAPADSRYRIFIIDEAHMVTNQGFNALLKIVEEPPEHLIFIFATTEPDKVIGTIRSRTHHYPFRLLTPPAMKGLLERTVAAEGLYVEDSVYPMVIAAGGGSPRDTLSILDQLLAGSGPDGLTYDIARPLLGVTDVTLLDDTIAALAQGDKAALFKHVDSIIEAGHEPRRFAIDLLERLRDLMILQAVPDAISAGLVDAPVDRGQILTEQAQLFSGAQLAHYAATVNEQIGALRGATSPRLLLEILCAHLVLEPTSTNVAPTSAGAPAQGAAPQQSGQQQSSAPSNPVASSGAAGSGASGIAAAQQAAQAIAARRNQQQSPQSQRPQQPSQQSPQQPSQPQAQQAPQVKPQQTPQTQPQNTPAAEQSTQQSVPQQPAQQQAPQQQVPPQQAEPQRSEQPSVQSQEAQTREPAQDVPQQPVQQQESAQSEPAQQPPSQQSEVSASADSTSPEPATPEQLAPQQQESAATGQQDREQQEPATDPAAAPAEGHSPEDLVEELRNNWQRLRASVSKRNKVAGIMLTEARVLGLKDDTLVLGHTTGALAERLNAPSNNQDVVAVVSEEAGRALAVNCIVGTDPGAAGFSAQKKKPDTWNPNAANNAAREASDDDQESESPRDYNTPAPTTPVDESVEKPTDTQSVQNNSGWGTPRALGGQAPSQPSPAPGGEPEQVPAPQPKSEKPAMQKPAAQKPAEPAQDWRARIAQAQKQTQQREQELRNSGTFSDGRPLPPDPGPEEYPEYESAPPEDAHADGPSNGAGQVPQRNSATGGFGQNAAPNAGGFGGPASQSQAPQQNAGTPQAGGANGGAPGASAAQSQYSREVEENDMMNDAREQGQLDRRSATEVAMELLARELGARKL
ncbi:DNA polymerase III subunit gamma and tau [Corynebacterium sp. L4756]|uniref:DNA polymerase III subunit gamma and tau n=1 Tax=unclassified Corynebacterium TaxID=2624378 RepID=UPI00374D51AA